MNTYDELIAALERLNKALDTKAYDSLEEKYVNEAYRAHRDKPGIWLEETNPDDVHSFEEMKRLISIEGVLYLLPATTGGRVI